MKTLIIFNDNTRVVAEKGAIVLPQSPHNIKQKIDLPKATEAQLSQLQNNPYNDTLVNLMR